VPRKWPRASEDLKLDRAIGCLQGQLIGDSLGALVEFRDATDIAAEFPGGVRNLADGGVWDTLAGQATDDSELALAYSLVAQRGFDADAVARAYGDWYRSHPFDIGGTTSRALSVLRPTSTNPAALSMAAANPGSAANGSLMRVSPIGIAARNPEQAADWAAQDSRLSHPHPQCVASCAAFAAAINTGIRGGDPGNMLAAAVVAAQALKVSEAVEALESAAAGKAPADFQRQMGWVLIALQNAFWHLAHNSDPVEALVKTVGQGGDTDTNGAIIGALLGAAYGRGRWPVRWTVPLLACRPDRDLDARKPRPETYWPDVVPELAEALLMSQA
jgi:ADP-ribosylglycohydrolase